jgi:hypothetical protein
VLGDDFIAKLQKSSRVLLQKIVYFAQNIDSLLVLLFDLKAFDFCVAV